MTTTARGTLAIPEAQPGIPPTSHTDLEDAVQAVKAGAKSWVDTDVRARIELLDQALRDTAAVAERWVRTACEFKRIPYESPLAGEEWLGGPVLTLRTLRLLRDSLRDIEQSGRPQYPGPVTVRPDGQVTVGVFPTSTLERALYAGFTGEIWMQPDVTERGLHDTMAVAYQGATSDAKVALVLGAGNVTAIPATDTLSKLFEDDEAVVLKMNPVNEAIGPVLEDAFRGFVDHGVLRVVYGGAVEGAYLTDHVDVDSVHITGSDKTHDAIVFGPGEDGARRKAQGEPRLNKPITSELGNVTPVIVVPGPWSAADLEFQAENLATMLAQNGGFNCIAARVIVTHAAWAKRRDLLTAVRAVLERVPQRYPYYPGAVDRFRAFIDEHPEAERFGIEGDDAVPFTLIPDLGRSNAEDIAFTTEAFCGVFGEIPLDAPRSIPDYLDQAVEFANDRLWGTLSASIIVHPRSLKDPAVAAAVDRAIGNLRYGSVVVNHWSALAYGAISTSWGPYPGHELTDIQSGRGTVHNTYLFDRPQKSVIRGPFRLTPRPAWFVTNRVADQLGRRAADFEADPSPAKLPGMVVTALRG